MCFYCSGQQVKWESSPYPVWRGTAAKCLKEIKMPVFDLTLIAATGVQVGLIGTAVFAVCVVLFGLKTSRKAL